jgi:hypothetical protein
MATGVPNAILAINSLDRYIKVIAGQGNQPVSSYLEAQYYAQPPFSNDFQISSPGALIYGYINRIVVSQIQVQYNVPTVIEGLNNRFFIGIDFSLPTLYPVTIPYGFYNPTELAAALETQINAVPALGALNFLVTYDIQDGFTFEADDDFHFPDFTYIIDVPGETEDTIKVVLKTYKLLGINIDNAVRDPPNPTNKQTSFIAPNFLYTPYIDFYSDVLTNYQNMKDTNTSISKPKGLIARVYLSGNGSLQSQSATSALGSAPFVVTADMNSPKIIKWSRDVAVPSIDFQLRDCYDDLLPSTDQTNTLSTEFQITLLCVEDER